MGQLATTVAEREKGKFLSQPIPNPKGVHEVGWSSSHQHEEAKSIMTLRKGKLFDNKVEVQTRKTSEPTSSNPTHKTHHQMIQKRVAHQFTFPRLLFLKG